MSTNTKPLKPIKQKARLTHRSRRSRGKLGKASALLTWVTFGLIAAMGYTVYVNRADELGAVGVVGNLAKGFALSCGGEYDPAQPAVFHPTLPCGTKVQLTNPVTGAKAVALVTNQRVAFNPGQGRTADISVATAETLGLNVAQATPHQLSLRVLGGRTEGLRAMLPVVPALQSQPLPALRPKTRALAALANNILHECGICSVYGQVAVAQVTENRYNIRYHGKKTWHDVVYDGADTRTPEFSWTMNPPAAGKKQMATAKKLAYRYLTGQLSGDLLAAQYIITRDALYYFQPELIRPPIWARAGNGLEVVPMLTTLEVEFKHRFLRMATGGTQLASN